MADTNTPDALRIRLDTLRAELATDDLEPAERSWFEQEAAEIEATLAPLEPEAIDWNARARAQYLCPVAAVARVMQEPTARAQVSRARFMLAFARNPQFRFDLLASDIPASVTSALESIVADLAPVTDAAVRALALRHRKLERRGFAQDEIWNQIEDEAAPLGFRYGDSTILRAWAAA